MSPMLRTLALGCPLVLMLGCVRAREPIDPVTPPAIASEPSSTPTQLTEDPPSTTDDALHGTGGTPIPAPEHQHETAPAGGHVVRPTEPIPEPGTIPRIEQTEPVVGTTDKDAIRRVVRMHISEIRACYNEGLKVDPALAGRITIEFVIGPSGQVEDATATDITGLGDPRLPTCIEAAIEQWVFPKPRGGGRVTVSYPFNLVPG
jgi:hypothetical protein